MSAHAEIIDIIQEQLEAYRQTGRAVHLAHAARALEEIREQLASVPSPSTEHSYVVGSHYRG